MNLSADQIQADPCEVFEGAVNDRGHGVTMFNGQKEYAHRIPFRERGINLGPLDIVHHKCNNKRCVKFSHLEIVNWSEHSAYHAQGEKNGQAILTEAQVLSIRKIFDTAKEQGVRMQHKQLAKLFNVSTQTITKIVNRNTWRHI